MKYQIPSRLVWALGLTLGLQAPLTAQTAPPAKETKDEEAVKLEAFVVTSDTDKGYIAVDSLAGGRTNTPIKLTPASMSSITRTFIDDLGIQNVREALKWAPNVVVEDQQAGKGFGGSAFHDWAFNFRGVGAGEQGGPGPTRNYFSFFQNADSYNIERIEFDRGPNSILFGLGTVGGTLSTYTKVPRADKDFITPTVSFDSNGAARGELDINRRVSDNATVRLNSVLDRNQGYRNNDKNDTLAVDLSVLYKVTDSTTLRVEIERVKLERTLISSYIPDKISGWDGTTASNTWGATPVGAARTEHMQNAGAWGDWLNPFYVWAPSLGSKALMAWNGGWASTTGQTETWAALPYQPVAGWLPAKVKLPWHSSYVSTAKVPVLTGQDWTWGNGSNNINYSDVTAFVDQKLGDRMEASVAYYHYYDDQAAQNYEGTGGAAIDINKKLPDGSTNPNYGKAFADFFLSKQTQSRSVSEVRAQLNYHFDSTLFGSSWKQLFTASAGIKDQNISARQYLGQVGNASSDWPQNMVWGRIYLDNPNQAMNVPEVAPNGKLIAYMPKADGYWFDFDDNFKVKEAAIASFSRFLDDKLSILVGYRTEHYNEHLRELRRGPNLTDNIIDESQSGNVFSAGGVYYFGSVGVFANYSKNLQPPHPGSQPLLNGNRPDPENGKGLEYGFKVSTSDGKYYATLGRYDNKSVGHLVENPIGFRGVWQKYNQAKGLPTESGNGNIAFSDTTSLSSTGYELDVTANPTKNFRLSLNYAKPDAKIADYYPGSRAYFAANKATWDAAVTSALTPALGTALQAEVAGVKNALDQALPGAKTQGLVDYTASAFGVYTFDSDALKGFSIGGGMAYTGKTYAGIFDNKVYNGSDVTSTNMVLAYETKFGRIHAHFAFNVDNVFDNRDPIVTSYHWGYTGEDGTHIKDGYWMQNPRTLRLTARFTF